jgi:hypothetical protein
MFTNKSKRRGKNGENSGSHGGEYEEDRLLGCWAV